MAIRKLNLVMTYPVQWDVYNVMNNLVQNFYDAVGSEQFMEHFQYKYENQTITLRSDVGFSREWLYFIGASTKRTGQRRYAGRFGEGFKVAALVAYRDLKLGICMESRDWKLTVTEVESTIDGKTVKVLAYDIEERPYEENAVLTLTNATQEHYDECMRQINHFYYPENSRFGEVIAQGETYAVYHAVRDPQEIRNWGSLFLNYQYRASLDLPIVVCNHDYMIEEDDRDRWMLSQGVSNLAVQEVFRMVRPREAMVLLEICRPRWKNPFGNDAVSRNWYGMLEILVDKILEDESVKQEFLERYGDQIITDIPWRSEKHKARMAMEWFRNSAYHKRKKIVSNVFARFDIPSVYSLCEQHHGFDEEAAPDARQSRYIRILETVAHRLFEALLCYDTLPECRILLNKEAPVLGEAHSHKAHGRRVNQYGLVVQLEIFNVYIQSYELKPGRFHEALAVYLHELLHQFGGDSSRPFKAALLHMNRIILENMEQIRQYEEDWRRAEDGIEET